MRPQLCTRGSAFLLGMGRLYQAAPIASVVSKRIREAASTSPAHCPGPEERAIRRPEWLFDLKCDGFRALRHLHGRDRRDGYEMGTGDMHKRR